MDKDVEGKIKSQFPTHKAKVILANSLIAFRIDSTETHPAIADGAWDILAKAIFRLPDFLDSRFATAPRTESATPNLSQPPPLPNAVALEQLQKS